MEIELDYDGASRRPSTITVSYGTGNDEPPTTVVIENKATEENGT